MSFCTMPIRPVKNAVVAPMNSTKFSAVCDSSNSGDMRVTMKMPAVTMVAAWIRAEIGVGPSIESGSQTCSGTWADLPIAPMNRQMQITVATDQITGSLITGMEVPNRLIVPDQIWISASGWPSTCALANTVA